MNYIDLAVLVIVLVAMALGLLGKLWKRIVMMLMIIISVPCSYLIASSLASKVSNMPVSEIAILNDSSSTPVKEWLVEKANGVGIIETIYNNSPSFQSLLDNSPEMVVKLVLFYVIGILGFIVFPIIGGIVYFIIKLFLSDKEKKKGAIWLFGIPSGVIGFIITLFVMSPIILFAPVLSQAAAAYNETPSPNALVQKILSKTSGYLDGSIVVTTGTKMLESHEYSFLTYEVEEPNGSGTITVKYYFYGEIRDIGVIINLYTDVSDEINGIINSENFDYEETEYVDKMIYFMDSLENVLGSLDEMRGNFSDSGHIKGITGDLLQYYLETNPSSLPTDSPFYFLNRIDMTGFDYDNGSLKDDLFPRLLQAFLDEMAINYGYSFLSDLDISSMTYAEIRDELVNLANLIAFYNDLDAGSLDDLTPEEIADLIASFGDSEIATQILENALSELGYTLPVDISEIDFASEGELIGDLIGYAGSGDVSSIDGSALAEDLASSDLALIIIESTPDLSIDVSDAQYSDIEDELNSQVLSGAITSEEMATLLGIFN